MPNTAQPQGPSLAAHSPLHHNPSEISAGPPHPAPNTQQPGPPGQPYTPVAQTQVILQSGNVQGPGLMYSPDPAIMQCPSCHQNIVTRVTYVNGLFTYMICLLVCCCALCIDACKDAVHTCPNCGAFIGTYRRL
ncbi:hypothetical protein RvY_18548 [Ramazzottius varieornatus]|uniref:LITAF domain-containing protein n=1 Tax=Ramazzottius varieornatus TaxID=947166 RepID=A0A1D1WBD0_RAMVA|nr:hypothetical protein RvY_18548 [Ramazzottius varieornatus]